MAAPRTTRTAAALAVGVLLSLGACTDDEGPGDRGPGVAVPALEEAWRVPLPDGGVWHDLDDARGDGLWSAPDAVSVVSDDDVTTYDALTGVVRSTVALPGEVCGVSRDLNPAGVGVVVLGPLEDCRTVVAVDTVAGEVRWQARLRRPVVVNDVTAGDRAVAVTDTFIGAQRLRLSDGSPLPTLGRGEAASDGTLVVVTPEGGGGSESYDVYDQDTGRLLRSLPAPPSTRVETLVSSDPLVVTASSYDDDGTFLRDLSGDRAVRFGRRTSAGYPRLAEHVAGSDLVAVQYGGSPLVATWPGAAPVDAGTLVLDPGERLVSGDATSLLTLTPTAVEVEGDTSVVRRVDPADPADAVVLGTVAADRSRVLLGTQAAAVVGDLLAVPVGDELVATVLPTTGPASSAVLSADGLIPTEHTPAEAGDLCGGLTSDTLASLGVTRPDLGVPADCTLHQVRPDEVWLVIDAWAELPSWEDQRTASDNAELAFDAVVRGDGVHEVSGLEPVDGLGDEAAVSADGDGLVVRAANVVVVVVRPAPLPGLDADGQREALLRVGEDLLAELARRG